MAVAALEGGVVDGHRHCWPGHDCVSESIRRGVGGFFAQESGVAPEEMDRSLVELWSDDRHASKLAQDIASSDIERAVLLVAGFDFDPASPAPVFRARNEQALEIAVERRDSVVLYVGAHPADPGCATAVADLFAADPVVRGVKLDPLAGRFRPDDERLDGVFAAVEANRGSVVVHTGPRPEETDPAGAHPRYLAAIAERHPGINVVAAHAGFSCWRDLAAVAHEAPNLYCDISGFQLTAAKHPGKFATILRRLLDAFGPSRVIFGTDAPTFDVYMSSQRWIDFLRSLPDGGHDSAIDSAEVEAVLRNGNVLL